MTTIITDGKYMLADRRLSEEDSIFSNDLKKLFKIKTGFGNAVFGTAGDTDAGTELEYQIKLNTSLWLDCGTHTEFIKTLLHTIKLERHKCGCEVLLATSKNRVFFSDHGTVYQETKTRPIAIGSGAMYARAAMLGGASIREAIKIAAKFDPFTSPTCTSIKI